MCQQRYSVDTIHILTYNNILNLFQEGNCMICNKCGAENSDYNSQCAYCGNPLTNSNYNQVDNTNNYYSDQYSNGQGYNQPQQYQQPQYQYQQPMYNEDEHVSIGMWIGIYCINLIPFVGSIIYLVMLFVWAFGSTPKKSLKNWAKAQLIVSLVVIVICVIIFAICGTAMFAGFSSYDYSY